MKIKNALLTLALALFGQLALAGPVVFSKSGLDGSFTDRYDFTVDSDAVYSGAVMTLSRLEGDLRIFSVVLSSGTQEYRFQTPGDFHSITNASSTVMVKGRPVTEWHSTYVLPPLFLTSNVWALTVSGFDDDTNKFNGSYTAQLDRLSGGRLPEPQSLALIFAALGALALVGRFTRRGRASGAR
jgi:hypothetical protein